MSWKLRAVSLLPLLAVAACVTMKVTADIDPQADFTSYRTFAWDPAYVNPTDEPRLENNPVFDSRVRSLVGEGLTARGLGEAPSGSADLLIHYHASVSQRVEVYTVDSEHGYEYYGPEDEFYEYEEGTLVLCFVEPRTGHVIWRGYVHTNVEGVLDNPELMEKRLAEAVRKVLERYPVQAGEG